jgi:four helix bundle protein
MIIPAGQQRLYPWRSKMSQSPDKQPYSYLENLECWQQAKKLAVDMYQFSTDGNLNHDFVLRDQLRKSAIAVASQIACGKEQGSATEFIKFLGNAKASAAELRTQLVISREIGYLSEGDFLDFEDKINRISAMLGGLIRAIRKRRESQK